MMNYIYIYLYPKITFINLSIIFLMINICYFMCKSVLLDFIIILEFLCLFMFIFKVIESIQLYLSIASK